MEFSKSEIEKLFINKGGEFISSAEEITNKLKGIKAFLFDWDGVFNEGSKGVDSESGFSEMDAIGIDMLRFSNWLNDGKEMPVCGIVTGADNYGAYEFAKREYFQNVYFKIGNKIDALRHMERVHGIKPNEVAFFFDDFLDLAIAKEVGLSIFMRSKAKVLISELVKKEKLADYITAFSGGNHGLREVSEMLIGVQGNFDETLKNRIEYSALYQEYLDKKNKPATTFYTIGKSGVVIEHHVA
ncbi:MAG: hypothetical protein ACPGEG_08820 [Salibacteraceae bacterium]